MAQLVKYRNILREIALDQYGYVTTSDAIEAGVPAGELPKLAARGGIVSISYGLYRFSDIPIAHLDQFAEALLRVGPSAFLYGETVLSIFGLAHVNPRKLQIGTTRRIRRALPEFIELVKVNQRGKTVLYEGLKSQPVADALMVCHGRIEKYRLMEASEEARSLGLISSRDLVSLKQTFLD